MRRSAAKILAILAASFLGSETLNALPIGFGRNQGDVVYDELSGKGFMIYHDHRTPHEARMTLETLEQAKPVVESWLGVARDTPQTVIMSAVTQNASFADFITDAIELQTEGTGPRDLATHEFVHATMYRHLQNIFGPPGAILHLPWMPAWWIEGLAESLSVSVGSDIQAAVERQHALTGNWPTYARLHSLYDGSDFAFEGYATAGAMTSWLLRTTDAKKLPDLMRSFKRYSQPWWWPWAAVPFNGFMPMDEAFKTLGYEKGQDIYEAYKKAATSFWKSREGQGQTFLAPGPRARFSGIRSLTADSSSLRMVLKTDDTTQLVQLQQNPATGWITGWKPLFDFPAETTLSANVFHTNFQAITTTSTDLRDRDTYTIQVRRRVTDAFQPIHSTDATILRLSETSDALVWLEHRLETTRLCLIYKDALRKGSKAEPQCPLSEETPRQLSWLGERVKQSSHGETLTREIWLRRRTQRLGGDLDEILVWNADTRESRTQRSIDATSPIGVAFHDDSAWLLSGDLAGRFLRKLSPQGECLGEIPLHDLPLAVSALPEGNLVLALYIDRETSLRVIKPASVAPISCVPHLPLDTPVLYAMRHPNADLSTALAASSPWQQIPAESSPATPSQPLGQNASDQTSTTAAWRARPVLLFPWIGADDVYGNQYGIISVPLMDHLQNETLRATMLYGPYSRFPHMDLSFQTTRYWPTLTLDAFRFQSYNGYYLNPDRWVEYLYYDERGIRATADLEIRPWGLSGAIGMKSVELKRFLAPSDHPELMKEGQLHEPFAVLTYRDRIAHWFWRARLGGRLAPSLLNPEFEYAARSMSASLGHQFHWRDATLSVGAEHSQTRGPKRLRNLAEEYRPLKTFVPGSGGGYNKNNFLLLGDGSLFGARQGDTQGRVSANATIPVIPELDKLLWIFYVDRLDFSAFVNYGGAWIQRPLPLKEELIAAHGYNWDLLFDIKGVRFNLGLGTGQVIDRPWQLYATSGFDAIF